MIWLTEVEEATFDVFLQEGKGRKSETTLARLRFPFAQGDVKNKNGRTYPSRILEREIERVNSLIIAGRPTGQLEHPALEGLGKIGNTSHVLDSLEWYKSKKIGFAQASVLATSRGQDLMVLLNENVVLGASMRGRGDVSPEGIVQENYQLATVDIVSNPSFQNAKIDRSCIFEGLSDAVVQDYFYPLWKEAQSAGLKMNFEEFIKFKNELEAKPSESLSRRMEKILAGFENDRRKLNE